MDIRLYKDSDLPIYEQIMNAVKLQILSGEVKADTPLPSIRGLAKDLQISVITTKRAYEELEKEGLIYSKAGRGFFVANQNVDFLREKKLHIMEEKLEAIMKECLEMGLSVSDLHEILDAMDPGSWPSHDSGKTRR